MAMHYGAHRIAHAIVTEYGLLGGLIATAQISSARGLAAAVTASSLFRGEV